MEEKRKEQIRKEARSILDKFGKTLGKVSEVKIANKGEGDGTRTGGEKCDNDFRERLFANAPNKKGDFVIAEKATW